MVGSREHFEEKKRKFELLHLLLIIGSRVPLAVSVRVGGADVLLIPVDRCRRVRCCMCVLLMCADLRRVLEFVIVCWWVCLGLGLCVQLLCVV